jgi:hypothetical protein
MPFCGMIFPLTKEVQPMNKLRTFGFIFVFLTATVTATALLGSNILVRDATGLMLLTGK